jgi:hypothetical protein
MPKKFHELSEEDYLHHSKEIDGKTVYLKSSVSEMTKQEFSNLSEEECEFIFQNLLLADKLLKIYSSNYSLKSFTAVVLDELIDIWNDDSSRFDVSEPEFINIIGSAFGHFLNKTLESKWLIVTDEYGTDYTCQIDEIKLRAFPINSVSKAIHQKTEGSLEDIYLMLKYQKSELEKDF